MLNIRRKTGQGAGMPNMPPGKVANSTSPATSSGFRIASSCAIAPPIENPSTWAAGNLNSLMSSGDIRRHIVEVVALLGLVAQACSSIVECQHSEPL